MQSLPSFSYSAVAFVTNFIGVKKAETPQLFGLPQSRDVILIAVRPDCAASAALPLLPFLSPSCSPPAIICQVFVLIAGVAESSTAHPIRFQHTFTFVHPLPLLGGTPAPSLAEL